MMPADRSEPVILEHPRERVQRLQVGGVDLGDPAAQILLGGVGVRDLLEAGELLREGVRANVCKGWASSSSSRSR